jgi:hypothetical protein
MVDPFLFQKGFESAHVLTAQNVPHLQSPDCPQIEGQQKEPVFTPPAAKGWAQIKQSFEEAPLLADATDSAESDPRGESTPTTEKHTPEESTPPAGNSIPWRQHPLLQNITGDSSPPAKKQPPSSHRGVV